MEICTESAHEADKLLGDTCKKLHVCQRYPDCEILNCLYPHDTLDEVNQKIIKQHNCENINLKNLIRFIRLHQTHFQADSKSLNSSSTDDATSNKRCACTRFSYRRDSQKEPIHHDQIKLFFKNMGVQVIDIIESSRDGSFHSGVIKFIETNGRFINHIIEFRLNYSYH